MKQKMIITMIACIGFSYSAIAQKAAIKTNLCMMQQPPSILELSSALHQNGHSICREIIILGLSLTIRSGSIGSYNLKRDIGSATR